MFSWSQTITNEKLVSLFVSLLNGLCVHFFQKLTKNVILIFFTTVHFQKKSEKKYFVGSWTEVHVQYFQGDASMRSGWKKSF